MNSKMKEPKEAEKITHSQSKQATATGQSGKIQIQVIADVNITAPIARRLVNTELMKKVGQMIMAGEAELLIDGQKIYWKVPFLVVPPDGDNKTYLTGQHALIDAISGIYLMSKKEVEELKSSSDPILDRLYPRLKDWMKKVKEAKTK